MSKKIYKLPILRICGSTRAVITLLMPASKREVNLTATIDGGVTNE